MLELLEVASGSAEREPQEVVQHARLLCGGWGICAGHGGRVQGVHGVLRSSREQAEGGVSIDRDFGAEHSFEYLEETVHGEVFERVLCIFCLFELLNSCFWAGMSELPRVVILGLPESGKKTLLQGIRQCSV